MSVTADYPSSTAAVGLAPDDLLPTCAQALLAAERFVADARAAVAELVMGEKGADPALLEEHQFAAHGYAWAATYATALREMLGWARRLQGAGRLGELEAAEKTYRTLLARHRDDLEPGGAAEAAAAGEILRARHGDWWIAPSRLIQPA